MYYLSRLTLTMLPWTFNPSCTVPFEHCFGFWLGKRYKYGRWADNAGTVLRCNQGGTKKSNCHRLMAQFLPTLQQHSIQHGLGLVWTPNHCHLVNKGNSYTFNYCSLSYNMKYGQCVYILVSHRRDTLNVLIWKYYNFIMGMFNLFIWLKLLVFCIRKL